MTLLQRWIAEETAADHDDGLMTRREAMRRVAQLSVSATATALIAACSSGRNRRTRGPRPRKR